MSKLLLTIAAAFLFTSTMAQAEVKTFDFTFSGESYSNTARATGFISFDTNSFLSMGNYISEANITNLSVTVSGTDNSNGVFNKSSFRFIDLSSPVSIDFSREWVGQTSANKTFGDDPSNQTQYGFMLVAKNLNNTPSASSGYTLLADAMGNNKQMKLTSFGSQSVAAVPEADTSAMLLMGAGVMGFMARRRKNTQA